MNNDFATAVKDSLNNPRCKGLTIWKLPDGRFQVSMAIDSTSNTNVNIDKNPMRALYLCMVSLERR